MRKIEVVTPTSPTKVQQKLVDYTPSEFKSIEGNQELKKSVQKTPEGRYHEGITTGGILVAPMSNDMIQMQNQSDINKASSFKCNKFHLNETQNSLQRAKECQNLNGGN